MSNPDHVHTFENGRCRSCNAPDPMGDLGGAFGALPPGITPVREIQPVAIVGGARATVVTSHARSAARGRYYVVTKNPGDWPGHIVARGWTITDAAPIPDRDPLAAIRYAINGKPGPDERSEAAALNAVRAHIHSRAPGLMHIPRLENDDPVIVETWL